MNRDILDNDYFEELIDEMNTQNNYNLEIATKAGVITFDNRTIEFIRMFIKQMIDKDIKYLCYNNIFIIKSEISFFKINDISDKKINITDIINKKEIEKETEKETIDLKAFEEISSELFNKIKGDE